MDIVTMPELRKLVLANDGECLSIYMPTHPTGIEGKQDGVRLKHLAAAAEHQLVQRGMRSMQASRLVAPIANFSLREKWEHRKSGLAIFRSKNSLVDFELDGQVQEKLVVAPRFYLRPLLPVLGADPRFVVLALSRNSVRVLKCTGAGHKPLFVPHIPTNIKSGLNLQTADRGEQVHSAMRGDLGKEAAVFHGQGGHRDTIKDELTEYFRLIDEALRPTLRQIAWPVILAGVDYELALYRSQSDSPYLAGDSLHGNFDNVTDQQLHEEALPIANRIYESQTRQSFSRYQTLLKWVQTSDEIDEIVPAAHEGRIDTLFFVDRAVLFGRYDTQTKSIECVKDRDPMLDLIELTIAQTLQHRGAVFPVTSNDVPANVSMCAILRYW